MFIILKTYREIIDAHIDKGYLESQGIKVRLKNEEVININWLWSQAMGGVQLQVHPDQIEEAKALLLDTDAPSNKEEKNKP